MHVKPPSERKGAKAPEKHLEEEQPDKHHGDNEGHGPRRFREEFPQGKASRGRVERQGQSCESDRSRKASMESPPSTRA